MFIDGFSISFLIFGTCYEVVLLIVFTTSHPICIPIATSSSAFRAARSYCVNALGPAYADKINEVMCKLITPFDSGRRIRPSR